MGIFCTCAVLKEDGYLYPSPTCISTCFDLDIHDAAKLPKPDTILTLLASGVPVDSFDRHGYTPLMNALLYDKKLNVRALLQAGASINITNTRGESALSLAFENEIDYKLVEAIILQAKAEAPTIEALVHKLLEAGCSFSYAALVRDADVLNDLLRRGFDVNSINFERRTALHFAALANDMELVKMLIRCQANVNALDHCLSGPLYFAAIRLNSAMMQLLLDNGATIYPTECRMFDHFPLFVPLITDESDDVERVHECTTLLLQHQAFPNTKEARLFIFDMLKMRADCDSGSRPHCIVAHLAMLDMLGNDEMKTETLLELHNCYKEYYFECQKVLQILVFGTISLFDLLVKCSDREMKLLIRGNKSFVHQIEQFCSINENLKKLYYYYMNTLTKRISKIVRTIELENKGISIICSHIFNSSYNEMYIFARQVVDYLKECDLEQLCMV